MPSLLFILLPFLILTEAYQSPSSSMPVKRISETLDIKSLKSLTNRDIVNFIRVCNDLEGRKTYLSVSAGKVKAPPDIVRKAFLDTNIIKSAIPFIRKANVIKEEDQKTHLVEFEVELKITIVKTSVSYISEIYTEDDFIFSVVKTGKNKGGWRLIEFFEDGKDTLVIFSMCEYIRVVPLANQIFDASPQIEMGVLSSTTLISLTSMKKYIESNLAPQL